MIWNHKKPVSICAIPIRKTSFFNDYILFNHIVLEYDPLKLMQAVTNKVNEICTRYSDNSQLTLLPGPNRSIFTASGVGVKNIRRSMEDRYVILHDLNSMFGFDVR